MPYALIQTNQLTPGTPFSVQSGATFSGDARDMADPNGYKVGTLTGISPPTPGIIRWDFGAVASRDVIFLRTSVVRGTTTVRTRDGALAQVQAWVDIPAPSPRVTSDVRRGWFVQPTTAWRYLDIELTPDTGDVDPVTIAQVFVGDGATTFAGFLQPRRDQYVTQADHAVGASFDRPRALTSYAQFTQRSKGVSFSEIRSALSVYAATRQGCGPLLLLELPDCPYYEATADQVEPPRGHAAMWLIPPSWVPVRSGGDTFRWAADLISIPEARDWRPGAVF